MAIHVPGKRDRNGKIRGGKRGVVALLQLTAMVDMFTVLVVFLLQNYAVDSNLLELSEEVALPRAASVKELAPSNVVVVSTDKISINNNDVADYFTIREQTEWMIPNLRSAVEDMVREGLKEKSSVANRIKAKRTEEEEVDAIDPFLRMTIQADENIDILTLKKVMFTLTEAGIVEINFAVIKKPGEEATNI
ncbi:MAG: adventurous gliding motility protein S [Bdellovibrionaceae bacterium]|nr:adventurous gliding motility protein S [Pseudobdellovibrionaceae bacterium]